MSAADQLAEALTAERDDAVRGMTSALRLVCDLRWALGDRGGRMQPELLEFARQLRKDAERYRWLREQCSHKGTEGSRIAANEYGMDWDAAIDAAMAPLNAGGNRK